MGDHRLELGLAEDLQIGQRESARACTATALTLESATRSVHQGEPELLDAGLAGPPADHVNTCPKRRLADPGDQHAGHRRILTSRPAGDDHAAHAAAVTQNGTAHAYTPTRPHTVTTTTTASTAARTIPISSA